MAPVDSLPPEVLLAPDQALDAVQDVAGPPPKVHDKVFELPKLTVPQESEPSHFKSTVGNGAAPTLTVTSLLSLDVPSNPWQVILYV